MGNPDFYQQGFPPTFGAKKHIWTFKCPVCGNVVRNDSDMEPLCTGSNVGRDDHPYEIMRLVK